MTQSALYGIVLAGGSASRLSGVDKPMLTVGGIPLLRRVIDALGDARQIVVVGPPREGITGVRWTHEEPRGAGPVAALAAGLARCGDLGCQAGCDVAVLAGDLAGLTRDTVAVLRTSIDDNDGAVLIDPDGRRQWLAGVWRARALRDALPAEPANAALRAVLGALAITDVRASAPQAADVDTEADLRRAREVHGG
ncbi:molybdenum cofactor guanylyltransferase [Haloechinothrix salitolerans]|uniref:Molybdenum cofactor guanylyltransferase n=1 Tax=Haloechinothrix salitolerans TaxID=926830 RepID=A0ABW2C029_9PSEU